MSDLEHPVFDLGTGLEVDKYILPGPSGSLATCHSPSAPSLVSRSLTIHVNGPRMNAWPVFCACNFESPLSGLWVGQILTLTILEAGKSKVKVKTDSAPS